MRDFELSDKSRSILLLSIVLSFVVVIGWVARRFDSEFVDAYKFIAADMLRKQEIAKRIDGFKIILGGGSNVNMGISAKKVNELTRARVINLGVSGNAYSLDLYFRYLKDNLNPGDLLVLSVTHLVEPVADDFEIANRISSSLLGNLSFDQIDSFERSGSFFKILPKYRTLASYIFSPVMYLDGKISINEFGDAVNYDDMYNNSSSKVRANFDRASMTRSSEEKVFQFVKDLRSTGVAVLVLPVPLLIRESDRGAWHRHWLRIDTRFNIKQISSILELDDFYSSESREFYSNYHPRDSLKFKRTQSVAMAINWYLNINDN